MRIKGGLSSTAKLLEKLRGAPIIEEAAARAVQKSALKIHEIAVKSISGASPGEVQKRYNPKRLVVAAKEGEPPNTDTGRLVQSIGIEFEDEGKKATVGTNLKYGAYLEFGTSKMGARPWLAPAVQEAAEYAAEIMQDELNKGYMKAFGIPKGPIKALKKLGKARAQIQKKNAKRAKKAKKLAKKLGRKIKKVLR